jgi:alcohol dehydrogenase (cytochrome c)
VELLTGVLRGHEGGPLVIGEVMYIHTPFPNRVFALDLNNPGRVLWRYEPTQDPNVIGVMCCDTVNRGPAYADGKIILSQADTTLVALDARTGQESGRSATATRARARPRRWRRWCSATRSWSASRRRVRRARARHRVQPARRLDGVAGLLVGTDEEIKFNPQRTTHLGQPVGENSSLRPGKATSGAWAAARPGAGSATTRSST